MIIVPSPGQPRDEFWVVVRRQLAAFSHTPEKKPPSKRDVATHIAHARRSADHFLGSGEQPAGLDAVARRVLHDLRTSPQANRPSEVVPPVTSRPEFEKALASAIARATEMRERHPDDGRIDAALQQLQTLGSWTAEGGIPAQKAVEELPILALVNLLLDPVWPMAGGTEELVESLLGVWIYALDNARAE
jgi:hypothetical protein